MPKLRNGNNGDSNPGSLACESGILPTELPRCMDDEQGRAITGGDVEEDRVGGRGHVLPEEGEPQNHLQERTAHDRA